MPADAPRPHAPDQDQTLPADAEATVTNVSTPEPDGARVAEAGHGYTGRLMDDALKTTARETDGEAAEQSDENT